MKKTFHKIKERRAVSKQHVTTRLRVQLMIFAIIILIILWVGGYEIYSGKISIILWLAAVLSGLIIGFALWRSWKIFWHDETQKVVSQMDKLWVLLLILYIIVEVGRNWFFGHWLQWSQLNAFCLIFLAWTLLWRMLSLATAIRKVLKEEEKI